MASGKATPPEKTDWYEVSHLHFSPAEAVVQSTRWNFSPWADFRTYMDMQLANTLNDLRQTSHSINPRLPVGIEGTQMPSAFGGYDLWRLSQSLDWIEPYDIGMSRKIFGSFMPDKLIMTTVFEKETDPARRRLWHLLLEGDRGCLIWWSEDCIDWKNPDLPLTPKAKALAPVLKELCSPLASLYLKARRLHDPIAIHYSQPSIQVDWLLESCLDGSTWPRRFSSFESEHNRMVRVRESWVKLIEDLGYTPHFVSSQQIEQGELARGDYRVVILPQSLALSDLESEQLQKHFTNTKTPRTLLFDGAPGVFDQHGRLRAKSPIFPASALLNSDQECQAISTVSSASTNRGDIALYASQRLASQPDFQWLNWMRPLLPLTNSVVLTPLDSKDSSPRVTLHRYQAGKARLFALERNISYQMSEDLKQAGGNASLEKPIALDARFAQASHLYDLRQQKYLGYTNQIHLVLDPWQPALLAATDQPISNTNMVKTLIEQLPK
jgi:hypothetical protein